MNPGFRCSAFRLLLYFNFFSAESVLQKRGYQSLLGDSKHSWGWNLVNSKVFHDSGTDSTGSTYPDNTELEKSFPIPDKFFRKFFCP